MTRLETTILYLLTKAHQRGKKNLSKFEVFKFLYLLEVEARQFTGKSFFESVSFVRDKNGPISIDIYNALNKLGKEYLVITEEKKADYEFPRHCISLRKAIKKFDLDDSEKMFMNSVFESYFDLPLNKLKKIVYNTEPMKKMLAKEKGSSILKGSPIDFNCVPLDEEMVDLITA